MKVERVDKSVQFYIPVQKLPPGSYRLFFDGRLNNGDIHFALRELPSPYTCFWRDGVSGKDSESGWMKRSLIFSISKEIKKKLALFIVLKNTESYDFGSLKLERMSNDDFLKATSRPSIDCRNFFRNSRLVLGLQAGWNPIRNNRGKITVCTDTNSPSGFSVLMLEGKKTGIYSEPFQTSNPMETNHVSVEVKGKGFWNMELFYSERGKLKKLTRKKFRVSDKWQRQCLSFKLNDQAKSSRAFALRISGSGKLLVDAFQAWAGAKSSRTYQSQNKCEVALAVSSSEYSNERIVFRDEPAAIDYCVTGDFGGASLKIKVFNPWGKSEYLPSVKLDHQQKIKRGKIVFNAFSDAPLGQFRIEAWVEREGKRISPYNELLITRLKRPVHLKEDAPNSPFGCHFLARPLAVRMLKAAGINWVRFHDAGTEYTGWYHIERKRNQWTFFDEEIQNYRNHHIKILGGLQTAPPWASYFPDSKKKNFNGYFDRYFEPKDLKAWSRYVSTITRRYKGVIDDFYIWNEPWSNAFWHMGYKNGEYIQSKCPSASYARISKIAFKAAKAANPNVNICGFNSLGGRRGRKWTHKLYDEGVYPFCNVVDYHQYCGRDLAQPGDNTRTVFNDATGYIRSNTVGKTKPIYMSEGQGNTDAGMGRMDFGMYNYSLPFAYNGNPILSGDRCCRFIISLLSAGCSKVFLYSAHTYTSLAVRNRFTALVGADGYPSVETAAFSNMTNLLEDTQYVKTIRLTPHINAYIFQGKSRSVAAISGRRSATCLLPLSKKWKIVDLFGNSSNGKYQGTMLYIISPLNSGQLVKQLLTERL